MRKLFLILFILFFPPLLTATQYTSKNLKSKDYEEMSLIINKYIKSSKKIAEEEGEEEALEKLKTALKILLMKPDRNTPKAPLFLLIQNEIIQYEAFMKVLHETVREAIQDLKSETGSLAYQASLLYVLENSLSYLQAITNKESELILTSIKTAKLKPSKEIYNYLLLEMERGKTASPSYLAERILKKRLKALKQKQKEELKKAKEIQSQKKKQSAKNQRSAASVEKQKPAQKEEDSSKKSETTDKTVVPIEL